jgi:hypothetical protein
MLLFTFLIGFRSTGTREVPFFSPMRTEALRIDPERIRAEANRSFPFVPPPQAGGRRRRFYELHATRTL